MPYVDPLDQTLGDLPKSAPVPEAVYHFRVGKLEYKEPKETDKFAYIAGTFVILDEEHLGRHVFQNFTLKPGAAFMFRNLCEACDLPEEISIRQAMEELIDREFMGATIIEAGKKGYSDQNKIQKFMKIE